MPVRASARWLFSGGAPPPKQTPPWDPSKVPVTPLVAREKKKDDDRGPKRSKRSWRSPLSAKDFRNNLDDAGETSCCKRIRCIDRFVASGEGCCTGNDDHLYNLGLLTLEQEKMAGLGMENDRKVFVAERVPLIKLSRGTMYAANSPVCNNAFTNLFGVSECLVGTVKGNPGARASPFTSR